MLRSFATPWTITCQAPLSMGFSGQEYLSGLPFLSPGDLLGPGIEPETPADQVGSLLPSMSHHGKLRNIDCIKNETLNESLLLLLLYTLLEIQGFLLWE